MERPGTRPGGRRHIDARMRGMSAASEEQRRAKAASRIAWVLLGVVTAAAIAFTGVFISAGAQADADRAYAASQLEEAESTLAESVLDLEGATAAAEKAEADRRSAFQKRASERAAIAAGFGFGLTYEYLDGVYEAWVNHLNKVVAEVDEASNRVYASAAVVGALSANVADAEKRSDEASHNALWSGLIGGGAVLLTLAIAGAFWVAAGRASSR